MPLVWYLTISHACVRGASLTVISSGVVPNCRLYLLAWWLTTGHVCWCSTTLLAMPVCMVRYYRPCLLECYLTIGQSCWCVAHCNQHFSSRVQMEEGHIQVCCYPYRGALTSDMSVDPVPLSDMSACTVHIYQICMLGSFIRYTCL